MKKNYKIYTIGLLSLALFASCADSLDKEPPLDLTNKEIFADTQHIESNLLGLYGSAFVSLTSMWHVEMNSSTKA